MAGGITPGDGDEAVSMEVLTERRAGRPQPGRTDPGDGIRVCPMVARHGKATSVEPWRTRRIAADLTSRSVGQYWDLKEPAKSRGLQIAANERKQTGPSNLASADSEVSPAELVIGITDPRS